MQRVIRSALPSKIDGMPRVLLLLAVAVVVIGVFAAVWETAVPAGPDAQPAHGTAYRMPPCLDPPWEPRHLGCPALPLPPSI